MAGATSSSDSTIFSLSNQSLKLDSAADITPHLAPLVASTTVTEIHFEGNTLGAPACAHLASIIRTKPTLRAAHLADIFTSRLLSEIPPALSSLLTALLPLQNLHTVDLSDNAFGLNTQAPLVAFLEKHTPLRHLILNNNGLGPHAGVLIADALTALAARKDEVRRDGGDVPHLETLVCGRNRLESGSMSAWARAFRAHGHIMHVRMVQNGIRQEGIAVLLREGLRECSALEILDLQDNTFTAIGSRALAEVVGRWSKLQELGVGDCLLGSTGWLDVVKTLSQGGNQSLQVVRAQYNEIDGKGVTALGNAVQVGKLEGLRRVELNGNKFSEDDIGVEALRRALESRGEGAGLDELSDLEEESEEEDEEEEEDKEDGEISEEETELKAETVLKELDQVEDSKVAQKDDPDVDVLAEKLKKTGI